MYPQLGTTIGYSDTTFGKAGLEASLDGYLTGLKGNAASTIWLAEWIYAQPPPGLDVRLSLDLDLQKTVDRNLEGKIGAAVVLNSKTGEVLSISSQPSFDPNLLHDNWQQYTEDPAAPLLNRATQGQYPLGTITGVFLYSSTQPDAVDLPETFTYMLGDKPLGCAYVPDIPLDWDHLVAAGCPGAAARLGESYSSTSMRAMFEELGFYNTPDFELPQAAASPNEPVDDVISASIGQSNLKVSPLQVALAAAQLSNGGNRPAPRLALAVETPHQGWVVLPGSPAVSPILTLQKPEALRLPGLEGLPVWEAVGQAITDDGKKVTWYVSGTLSSWPGTPLAMSLILEEDNPSQAVQIGRDVMRAAINPD